jgi:hypothetical protein
MYVGCLGGSITSLKLPHNNMAGTLTGDVAHLTNLAVLDLGANALSGSIPEALTQLSALTYLSLIQNEFTGRMPNLPFDQYIGCFLEGAFECPLPIESAQCVGTSANSHPAPQCVPCTSTGLSQSDCAAFQAFFDKAGGTGWTHCSAYRNDPCACSYTATTYPGEVRCTGGVIDYLSLHDNNLAGSPLTEMSRLTHLTAAHLYSNHIAGTIPDLTQLTNLGHLALWGNSLTGEIPVTLGKLTALVDVSLFLNKVNCLPQETIVSHLLLISSFTACRTGSGLAI